MTKRSNSNVSDAQMLPVKTSPVRTLHRRATRLGWVMIRQPCTLLPHVSLLWLVHAVTKISLRNSNCPQTRDAGQGPVQGLGGAPSAALTPKATSPLSVLRAVYELTPRALQALEDETEPGFSSWLDS